MVGVSVASAFFNSGTSDQTVTSIGSATAKLTGFGVNISPALGWFISENTAVGFTLNLNPNGQKTTFEQNGATFQKDKSSGFNIGAGGFVRNYFGKAASLLPFGQASLNGGISTIKEDGFLYTGSAPAANKETYDGKSSGGVFFNATFTAGLTKMLGEYTGLDFFIGYTFSYNKNTYNRTTLVDNGNDGSIDQTKKNETTTKFTNHGVQLGVAFQVFLQGKGKGK